MVLARQSSTTVKKYHKDNKYTNFLLYLKRFTQTAFLVSKFSNCLVSESEYFYFKDSDKKENLI